MTYRYLIYVDRHDGKGKELAAWYDDIKAARREARFLQNKGYDVEIRYN